MITRIVTPWDPEEYNLPANSICLVETTDEDVLIKTVVDGYDYILGYVYTVDPTTSHLSHRMPLFVEPELSDRKFATPDEALDYVRDLYYAPAHTNGAHTRSMRWAVIVCVLLLIGFLAWAFFVAQGL